jgi:hypothetical protein
MWVRLIWVEVAAVTAAQPAGQKGSFDQSQLQRNEVLRKSTQGRWTVSQGDGPSFDCADVARSCPDQAQEGVQQAGSPAQHAAHKWSVCRTVCASRSRAGKANRRKEQIWWQNICVKASHLQTCRQQRRELERLASATLSHGG